MDRLSLVAAWLRSTHRLDSIKFASLNSSGQKSAPGILTVTNLHLRGAEALGSFWRVPKACSFHFQLHHRIQHAMRHFPFAGLRHSFSAAMSKDSYRVALRIKT